MIFKRKLFFGVAILASALLLSSCVTLEKKGLSVKNYKPEVQDRVLTEEEQAEMEKELRSLGEVRENSVFSEKKGLPEYRIGPRDVIQIIFWEGSKPNIYSTEVRSDGRISYSFADDILVSGHTMSEVHDILVLALQKYIRNPRLEVTVKEYRSKKALLFGQINILQTGTSGPGKYPLTGKTTVLDLIVTAGGPVSGKDEGNADLRRVEVVRGGKRYTLNLFNAMFKGDMSQNIILEDMDIITVPELPFFGERVYVLGEVGSQGIFRLKDAYDLLAALSKAGGPTRIAVKSDIKIIREYRERDGKPLILSANYDQITKQGDIRQNIILKDGDVVYVPRTVVGDINEFIVQSIPMLDYLFYPARFRDSYGDPTKMRPLK